MWPWRGQALLRDPLVRNHRKLLVIDDDVAFVGGMNVASEYAGKRIGGRVQADRERMHEQRGEQVALVSGGGEQHVLVDRQHVALRFFRKIEAVRQRGMDGQRHRSVALPQVAADVRAHPALE